MPDPQPTTGDPPTTGTPPPTHSNGAATPQTDPPETLRALQSEREARQAAERAAATAKSQWEAERNTWKTERDALTASVTEANSKVTTSEVKRLLGSAGCVDVDVAAAASEFRTVDPAKIAEAVTAFQAAHPSMFPKTGTSGHSFDGGAQPGQTPPGRNMNDVIRKAAGKG